MSNTVEIVTKLRDEMSGALNQQKAAFDRWSQSVNRGGQESTRTAASSSALSRAMGSLAGQFTLGSLAANAVMGAVAGVRQAVQKLLADAVRLTVEMADLTDAMNYLYVDAAGGLIDRLDGISEATGYTRSALYGLTRDVGAMTAEFSSTRAEAAMMAGDITQASADAAAALGLDLGTAAAAVQGAMRGMSRSARTLGIDIGEDAIQAELTAMGINQLASEVEEGTLIQARYNIVMAATARYSGAAAAEMETLEGAQRRANVAYEEMALQIGDAAAPMLERLTNAGSSLIPVLGDILSQLVTLLGTAINPIAQGIADLSGIFNLFKDIFEAVGDAIVDQLPFLGDLKDIWDGLTFSWSDADTAIRNLLGLQEEETAVVATQTGVYRGYVSALSSATEAEVRLALAMLERMNVMGALDPMMAAARERLEALKIEAEASADSIASAYQAAFQAKKESGYEGGGGASGGGGGGGGEPPSDEDFLETKKEMWAEAAQAIEDAEIASAERIAEKRIAEEERVKQAVINAEAEAAQARQDAAQSAINHALEMGSVIGDVLAQGAQDQITFAEGMESVGQSMLGMIVQAASQAVMAYAAEAAAAAAASQAGIPVIGPILAAAAMGSMLALVQGLLGGMPHAASGWTVPGSHAGDRVPAMVEPGERILTRAEARDYTGGGSRGNTSVMLTLNSMFSGASRSDLQRAGKVLREVMDAEGV